MLTTEHQVVLEYSIQVFEALQAIDKLKLNKTPGPDVFTAEFYEKFKHVLAPKLCRLFGSCLTSQHITPSWSQAHVVVISKEDKDSPIPQSYHPISLLNTDYKILMTILAAWMNLTISSYIHVDQSGFIQNRYLKIFRNCTIL